DSRTKKVHINKALLVIKPNQTKPRQSKPPKTSLSASGIVLWKPILLSPSLLLKPAKTPLFSSFSSSYKPHFPSFSLFYQRLGFKHVFCFSLPNPPWPWPSP
ncbi:hypothetical protein PRUPE_4G072900, partial [Prunus persica]